MPYRHVFVIDRFKTIIGESLRPLKVVLLVLSLVASVSMLMHNVGDMHDDFALLTSIMPAYCWAGTFMAQAVFRHLSLFTAKFDYHLYIRLVAPIIGIWIWSMMLISGIMATPMEELALLYGVVVLAETWIFGREFSERSA
jgi:hypothetical protein